MAEWAKVLGLSWEGVGNVVGVVGEVESGWESGKKLLFKIDKRKRFKLTLEIFRDIFKICPRVQGQDFDALPTDDEIMSFLRELRHTGEINSLSDTIVLNKLRLSRAQILWGMYHQKNVDYVELLWEDFIYRIDNRPFKKQEKMYYPRFTKVIIHYFFTQDKTLFWRNKIGMHTSRDDYLINTLRFVSAKEETQIYGVVLPESLTNPEMKETQAYQTYLGYATLATPPKKAETLEMPLSKKKEKMTVEKHKGIDLLSEIALSVAKIKPSATSEGTGVKPGVPDVAKEESSEKHETDESESSSESDHDESEEEDEDNEEAKNPDKAKGDEDEDMNYTTSHLYDDMDIMLNEPVYTDKGCHLMPSTGTDSKHDVWSRCSEIHQRSNRGSIEMKEGTDAAMTNVQQENENPEILQVTSSSHSSDLAAKFLNFLNIPHIDAKVVSLMDVYVHHEVSSQQTLKLLTVPILVISDSSPILPKEVSNFAPIVIQSMVTESLKQEVLAKESSQPQSSYEAAATLTEFELKNILIEKIDKSESYLAAPEHRECYKGLKKSYNLDKTFFTVYGKVYSLKRSRKDKDKDEDPSNGSD
nr:hypothetical protein [Tanacetum cinerariifolium]